jgi:hypothetical protein
MSAITSSEQTAMAFRLKEDEGAAKRGEYTVLTFFLCTISLPDQIFKQDEGATRRGEYTIPHIIFGESQTLLSLIK